jgi:GntR family transcriptional regulator / MocR family aminotransferase
MEFSMSTWFDLPIDVPAAGSNDLVREVHRQVRSAILDGRLPPNSRLPSTRDFAKRLAISRNSMLAVYDLLLGEGYLFARPGSGTFVADVVPAARRGEPASRNAGVTHRDDIRLAIRVPETASEPRPVNAAHDFRLGYPDISTLPFNVWRRLSDRALRRLARQTAEYADPQGQLELRAAIANHLSLTRALSCGESDVVVTAGAQQAFVLLAKILVVPTKTVVAVEQLSYAPMREAMLAAGAKVASVPMDAEGLRVDLIPSDARIICVTPSHQFPTGIAMSLQRRAALLKFAAESKAVVIEDDYDSELRLSGRPLDALQTMDRAESVFYVGTFSKSLFPALRLGFVVGPGWARESLVRAKQLADWHSPILEQETLAAFIVEGHLGRHIRKMRAVYRDRRDALLAAIDRYASNVLEPIPSAAGLHLGAWFRADGYAHDLVSRAASVGIAAAPFSRFFEDPCAADAPNGMAFGYGLIGAHQMDEAIKNLAHLV